MLAELISLIYLMALAFYAWQRAQQWLNEKIEAGVIAQLPLAQLEAAKEA